MVEKFLVVNAVGKTHHIIALSLIQSICPKDGGRENKSIVYIKGSDSSFYSTETPIEIYEKIKALQAE